MDDNEVTEKATDDRTEDGNEEDPKGEENASELGQGKGWTIPDGESEGNSTQGDIEEDIESSKDGSQIVSESMFTDSDGGSTIKMNGQCHSDATQTGEDTVPDSHSVEVKDEPAEVKDEPMPLSPDPSHKDTIQPTDDVKETGQLIVSERESSTADGEMSDLSDIVNNNQVRELTPEEQGFQLERLPSSNKFQTVASSGSLFSEDGYQTFPGADQSRELLKREVYGREDDDSEAVSSCTDTSNLAQLIVDHVLENVVGTFQDESDSGTSGQEVLESLDNDVEMEERLVSMDQAEEVTEVTEEKEYASKMELESDLKPNKDDMTDFQLDEPQSTEDEFVKETSGRVDHEGDEDLDDQIERDSTASDAQGEDSGTSKVLDPQFPEKADTSELPESSEAVKETSDNQHVQGGVAKSRDSGVSMSCASEGEKSLPSRSITATFTTSEIEKVGETIPQMPTRQPEVVPADSVQEYDTQRLSEQTEERGAEKPYEDTTFKELIPEDITKDSFENDVSDSLVYPRSSGGMAYDTVSSPRYMESSSLRMDQSAVSRISEDVESRLSNDRDSSSVTAIHTPPRMVLRTKQEFLVKESSPERDARLRARDQDQRSDSSPRARDQRSDSSPRARDQRSDSSPRARDQRSDSSPRARDQRSDSSPRARDQDQRGHREAEMLREQMILDKVRKDMAAKERDMRRQIDREMNERMERAKLEQELMLSGGEYYRSENDLSHSTYDRSVEFDTSDSSRLRYANKFSSRSPQNTASFSPSVRGSSDSRVSEEDLIKQYQRELSRSEQREHRQYHPSGIDTYATLQNPPSHHHSSAADDPHHAEGMSYADISRSDHAMPGNIYSSYNIPPPQYNVSTSFGAQNSSHTSSDLEAPPPKSGSVPPFKTLHEQQIGWMRMFKTLEEQHHNELKNQYRQHQETIFSMQHHIENELFSQQQVLKQRLSAHKEALSTSASSIPPSQERRLDNNELASSSHMLESSRLGAENSQRKFSPKSSPRSRPMEHSPSMGRHPSPPWKEVYREIRGKGIDSDRETEDNEEETPVRRSLEDDFMSASSFLRQSGIEEVRPQLRKPDPVSSELPRGGVFSSPMPILRKNNVSQRSPKSNSPRQANRSSPRVAVENDLSHRGDNRLSNDRSCERSRLSDDRSCERSRLMDDRSCERTADPSQDSMLSEEYAAQRVNLRNKHAKHLSDLREYYEQEIHELRAALSRSDDITSRSPFKRVAGENQALITENHSLKHANEEMESQLNKVLRENRALEQKIHGLERRASEYADHYKEAQDKISTFRNKVEELQFQNRAMEDQIQHLECQIKNQADAIKHHKKAQEEQMEVLQKDRNTYHKLADKYDSLEKENNVLKESFNVTENKLYDARSEVVELNRTVSKLELENKRIGRENDNMRYKLTQSANAVTIQGNFDESYGSPGRLHHPSPVRDDRKQTRVDNADSRTSHARSRSQEISVRSLAGDRARDHSFQDDIEVRSQGQDQRGVRSKGQDQREVRSQEGDYRAVVSEGRNRETESHRREYSNERRPKNTCDNYDEIEEMETSHQRQKPAPESSRVSDVRVSGVVDQTSPVLRAERELYKLREIMRQAEQAVEAPSPQQPTLQKKFYGSESGISINKSESRSSINKSDSSSLKLRKKKFASSSPEKPLKVRSSKSSRYPDSDTVSTPSKAKFERSPGEYDSPTRFDINVRERPSNRQQPGDSLPTRDTGSKPRQGSASKDKRNGETRGGKSNRDRKPQKTEKDTQIPNGTVENTLNRMREGEFVARPQWENIYTSMAKPKSDNEAVPIKQTVKKRLDNISDLETRYDELHTEKRTLESQLSRVPSHGKGRQEKENLEDKLDKVEKELGSVRMSLKRYHVLKTSI